MSRIKAWLHDQMEKQLKEEELYFNAEMHHELEEAMRNEMDPPEDINPKDNAFIDNTFISNNPDAEHLDTPF